MKQRVPGISSVEIHDVNLDSQFLLPEKSYSLSKVLLREFSLINPKIEALQVFQALGTRIFIVIG